jgi:hypothetical protein
MKRKERVPRTYKEATGYDYTPDVGKDYKPLFVMLGVCAILFVLIYTIESIL